MYTLTIDKLSPELHAQLEQEAKRQHRSLTQHVVLLLENAVRSRFQSKEPFLSELPLAPVNLGMKRDLEPVDFATHSQVASETGYLTGETTLYGFIQGVGGEPPTALIKTIHGIHLSCAVNDALARQLGNFLYTKVGLIGIATWSLVDNSICAFEIKKLTKYQDTPLTEAFSLLSAKIGEDYKDIDPVAWVSALRTEED